MIGVGRKIQACIQEGDNSGSSGSEGGEEEQEQEEDKQHGETLVEWIRRATAVADGHMERANVEDSVEGSWRRKWRMAGQVARRRDDRWASKVLGWTPKRGARRVGRPKAKWWDAILHVVKTRGKRPSVVGSDSTARRSMGAFGRRIRTHLLDFDGWTLSVQSWI